MNIVSLLIALLLMKYSCEGELKYYEFKTFDTESEYIVPTINTTKYNSSDSCVTMQDLIAFHFTETVSHQNNEEYVTPENFCYGIIDYNITRTDFFNIIQKNFSKNYYYF
jgi:hypothetical protein